MSQFRVCGEHDFRYEHKNQALNYIFLTLLFRAKCSVLYLGTAISSPGQRGIDAIQEPLSRRYPVDGKEVVRGT